MRLKNRKISVSSTILLCLLMLVMLMPFYVLLVGAFKPNLSLISSPMDLNPFQNLTLKNFIYVLQKSDIWLWMKNSLIISTSVAVLTAMIGVCAGYAFSKIRFRGKTVLFTLVMATMMMPKQMLLIPNYIVAYNLHLENKLIGVILTTIAPAFGVFLSRQFITSLPKELFDAAEIDGCGEFRKFTKIALPLSLPAVGTISIFAFFSSFNDYLWQLIMISDKALKTIPVGIAMFSQAQTANKAAQLTSGLIATIPLIVIFILFQKFFIKGSTAGAVKG